MKMTFTDYEEALKKYEAYPNAELSDGYGITWDDIDLMEEGGDKFVPFLMYLTTRPWYRLENRVDRTFDNEDAISCKDAADAIDELLYKLVEQVDDDEQVYTDNH